MTDRRSSPVWSPARFRLVRLQRIAFPATLAATLGAGFLPSGATARDAAPPIPVPALRLGEPVDDRPAEAGATLSRAAGDTLYFGNVDLDGYAIQGDVWSFDHGGGDPLEGWTGVDVTEQDGTYGRQITAASWGADPGNPPDAPLLSGQGSAWIGAFQGEADARCWEEGLGYGNDWCQRLASPTFTRNASADVELSWVHFNDTEEDFDYVEVYVELLPSGDRLALRSYTGEIGLAPAHPADPPEGAPDAALVTVADFAGHTEFRLVFELDADGAWSDEDGNFGTVYGPCGLDDVVVAEAGGPLLGSFDFESDLDSFSAEACPGLGSDFGVAPLSDYVIEDACDCDLAGNVLEFHDGNGEHPTGQHAAGISPPVDVLGDVLPNLPGSGGLAIFAEWDQYTMMPQANGVFYRPGWQYYPWTCETTGAVGWSPRVGQSSYWYGGEEPVCAFQRSSGTEVDGEPVPADAERVRFHFEIYSSCDAFGISPEQCTGETNPTPLVDNVRIGFTRVANAPSISFELGTHFEDGFAQNTSINDPHMPGRADVTRNIVGFGNSLPWVLGDSLQIAGPTVTNAANRWEARLWFRVPRVGPGADARYTTWRDRVADGFAIDPALAGSGNPIEFAFGMMDSVQIGTSAFRNKFCSYFRETDDDYDSGQPELRDGNEIIADYVLFPGTQVEYFVTANYLNNPAEHFVLPDTSGGYFNEFEILPSWRDEGGVWKYPCFLYIDAYNAGAQAIVGPALEQAGIAYDRYDYLDACGCWRAPLFRGYDPAHTNGCTLTQLLGYRGVFVNRGLRAEFFPEDYAMFSDYLTAGVCTSDRRGLVMNGADAGADLAHYGPSLLANQLGATFVDDSYREYSGDEAFCVQLEAPSGGGALYGTTHSGGDYEYGAYGNGCPQVHEFDVLGTVGSGVGNRVYVEEATGTETPFAQVVNEVSGASNYRTVLDGTSWHVLAGRTQGGGCDVSEAERIAAASNEIRAAAEWIYGIEDFSALCTEPCEGYDPSVVDGPAGVTAVTRLFPSAPNPFSPRTALRFSLATEGPASLAIFDAAGRRVRTLVDAPLTAGSHEAVWDGTDDRGARLASGTYWAKLAASGRESASRLVLLK